MLTADRIQNVDEVQNVDCRLQIGYKMQTEDLKSFFVWFVITCHLTTYRASRNYFSAVSFHDYLHYFETFLAHFLMKIDRTIISNLHSLLTLRASWLVWCLYRLYQRNKSRCHYWIFNTRNIRETIDSFARGPYYHLFKRYVFILLTKMRTGTKTVPSTWFIFDVSRSHHNNLSP